MTEYILSGTGSRTFDARNHPRECAELMEDILRSAHVKPDLKIVSGGAEGWDHTIATVAELSNLPLILMLPNKGYGAYYWRDHSITGTDRFGDFQHMVDYASEVIYVCNALYVNGVHANFVRNQAMVDKANEFVIWAPTSRGTANCFRRIKDKGLPYKIYG